MNIHGLGTEIVEVLRIAKLIERHGDAFLNRVFTPRELKFCQNRAATTQFYAAVWAVKQAVLKAAGITWSKTLAWTDLEIRPQRSGTARVLLRGSMRDLFEELPLGEIHLTMAHCRSHATATALICSR